MHIKCPKNQLMYKNGQINPELMYTKMKYMLGKHDAWHGPMVGPHRALVKFENIFLMSSCTPFINQTITEEVPWLRGGNHQD